jgi:hypothetical protein
MSLSVLWGQAAKAAHPKVWQSSSASSDDGLAIMCLAETSILAPAGLGGECAFPYAHVTVTSSMSALIHVTPIIDGEEDDIQLLSTVGIRAVSVPGERVTSSVPTRRSVTLPGSTVEIVRPTFATAQQTASRPGALPPRVTQTFPVPLLRRLVSPQGAELARFFCRGSRLALRLESVGALGAGELIFDGVEVEYQVLSKSKFLTVST